MLTDKDIRDIKELAYRSGMDYFVNVINRCFRPYARWRVLTTENGQYIASVRFTGTVSEDLNSAPQAFTEIWHFVKPAGSSQDWLVAGIQQES